MNPFAQSRQDRVGSLGETVLIKRISEWLGAASPDTPAGIGDDCSAVHLPSDKSYLLTTTDPVIYQRHFDGQLKPEQVAIKLLNRNISDIASMGGTPRHATLSLALPNHLSIDWLRRFYIGLSQEAYKLNIQVNGGDVTPTEDFLGAFMTLVGYGNERILERKGASVDALVFVTGSLGGSRLKKHFNFEPRLPEGQWLATQVGVSSCMDLSDGIGKDCAAILLDHCNAIIDASRIPVSEDAHALSQLSGRSPLDHAINDGEDYELLFTLEPDQDYDTFVGDWKTRFKTSITQIGIISKRVASHPSVVFSNLDEKIEPTGYDPFRTP